MNEISVPRKPVQDLAVLVDAIGREHFGAYLLTYLHDLCGADHCTIFKLEREAVSTIGADSLDGTQYARDKAELYTGRQYWRKDPTISQARQWIDNPEAGIVCVDINELEDSALRQEVWPHVRARLMICGQRRNTALGLSILRSNRYGMFSDEEVGRLGEVANLLMSVLGRHTAALVEQWDMTRALTSLPEIEACLSEMTDLTRREAQICARIVYGLYSTGIALDLKIGEESVKTYRKRAYQRLGIGSERELLVRYLALWGSWRCTALSRAGH